MDRISIVVFIILFHYEAASGDVHIKSVQIPTSALQGTDVTLNCLYDLGSGSLYSVKWYKNSREIYRYFTSSQAAFRAPGVRIDEYRSNEHRIVLLNVTLNSTGRYRCEITPEPSFHTISSKGRVMTIVVPPSSGPVISKVDRSLCVGDVMRVNCSTEGGRPSPALRWNVNGHTVSSEKAAGKVWQPPHHESTQLGLQLHLKQSLFNNSYLTIQCEASLADVWYKSVSLQLNKPETCLRDTNTWGFFSNNGVGCGCRWEVVILLLTAYLMFTSYHTRCM